MDHDDVAAVWCGGCDDLCTDVRQVPDWCPECRARWRMGAPHCVVTLGLGTGPAIEPTFALEFRGAWTDTHRERVGALLRDTFGIGG